ncbi:MAG: biotin/lipoyl-binding protein, partial [Anaerolineales bacterium]
MSSTKDSSSSTSTTSHKRNFWYIAGSIVIILIIGGGYLYYQSAQQQSKAAVAAKSALQTATVRQGSIVISASGTGTVVAAATANLGFPNTGSSSGGNGTLTQLNVVVGDQVKAGELLAAEDNTNQAQALAQAKFNLAQLTSPAALATAQGAIATDQVNVNNAYQTLEFLISPERVHWEEEVATAQQNLTNAQLDAQASPSADATQKVQDAQNALNYANQQLQGAIDWYGKVYVPEKFTYLVSSTSGTTGGRGFRGGSASQPTKVISPPTNTMIAGARAALALAQAQEVQDQDLVTAISTGVVPDTATGPSLTALKQAETDLQNAQTNFDDTQIISPINGTVTAVANQIGDTVGSATVITVSDL